MNYNTIITILLTMLFTNDLYGQKKAIDYYNAGIASLEDNHYSSALKSFNYVRKHYPNDEVFDKATYNAGTIYYSRKKYARAEKIFKYVLGRTLNDREASSNKIYYFSGFANYKHNSACYLSEIYTERGVYDTALYYLSLSDSVYPFNAYCSWERATYWQSGTLEYARIYDALGQIDNEEEVLLRYCLPNSNSTKDSEAIAQLRRLYKQYENPKKLLAEVNYAFEHYLVDTSHSGSITDATYCISFRGKKIPFYSEFWMIRQNGYVLSADNEWLSDRDFLIGFLRKSAYYKMVKEL